MNILDNSFSTPTSWMFTHLFYALFLLVAGCSGSDSPRRAVEDTPPINVGQEGDNLVQSGGTDQGNANVPESISAHQSYEYAFFEPEDCPADPVFNCSADLTLCADGSSLILITDIINSGTYTQTEDTIISNWGLGDVPSEIRFTVRSDRTLTDDVFGFSWEPVQEGVFDDYCNT